MERSSEFESELGHWKCHVLPLHYNRIMVVLPRIELGLNDYESSTLTFMLQNLGARGETRTHNRLLRREMNYPVVLLSLNQYRLSRINLNRYIQQSQISGGRTSREKP